MIPLTGCAIPIPERCTDPTKFFGLELGSQSRYEPKEDRAVVNGAHDGRTLSELLNKFIKSFILCPKCRCAV